VFVRSLLRKIELASDSTPCIDDSALSAGERQLCLLLVNKGLAATRNEEGRLSYVLDPSVHENLVESLATRGLPLRARGSASASA
jgi:hypothetical protein